MLRTVKDHEAELKVRVSNILRHKINDKILHQSVPESSAEKDTDHTGFRTRCVCCIRSMQAAAPLAAFDLKLLDQSKHPPPPQENLCFCSRTHK